MNLKELFHGLKNSHRRIRLKVKKLPHFQGLLPKYESKGASGCDIRACLGVAVTILPGQRVLIPTGLVFEIPKGFELQVRPRSGLALKKGITLLNTPGTIDSDYRGEVKVLVINSGKDSVLIENQDRLAQLVLCPVYTCVFKLEETLSETRRSSGGFGSTGK